MIAFNNGITNINNTPGIISDTAANLPSAELVAIGTIYIETDTGKLQQSNGTTWVSLGGGAGATPGIDDVLAVGQALSANGRIINLNTHDFQIIDNIYPNNFQFFISNQDIVIGSTYFDLFFNITGILATRKYSSVNSGIYFNFSGDFYNLGTETTFLQVNSNTQNIFTEINSNKQGYDFLNLYYRIGDFDAINNGNKIEIDDVNELIYLRSSKDFQIDANHLFFNGSITQASSGSVSGLHLQVTINGTNYVIELKNP